jgi:hypothetical protein
MKKRTRRVRRALLVVDSVALVGLVIFSVLGALERRDVYVGGQIVCAVVVLGTVLLLRRLPPNAQQ